MSKIKKRSVVLHGRKTSLSLENEFWQAVLEICHHREMTVSRLVEELEASRDHANLSSAVRLYVLQYYRDRQNPLLGTALHADTST